MRKDTTAIQKKHSAGRRITSLAAWSPDIAWRLLTDEERELLYRYYAALQEERHKQATPQATAARH